MELSVRWHVYSGSLLDSNGSSHTARGKAHVPDAKCMSLMQSACPRCMRVYLASECAARECVSGAARRLLSAK